MNEWSYKPAGDFGLSSSQRLRSVRRESGLVGALAHRCWRMGVGAYLRALHRLRIEGRENIPPRPPFVLVANHASHLDVLCLASALPRSAVGHVFPIAAGDTFFETVGHSAFAAGLLNALPMWRRNCGRHALQELRRRLVEEPCGYILFPEGTRTRTGEMSPFKSGIGMLVAGTSVPVVPCWIEGAFEAMPPGRRFPRPRRLQVRIGRPLLFADVSSDRAGWERATTLLEQAVRACRGG